MTVKTHLPAQERNVPTSTLLKSATEEDIQILLKSVSSLSTTSYDKEELATVLNLGLSLLERVTNDHLPQLWTSLGEIYTKLGESEQAIKWFQQVVAGDSKMFLQYVPHALHSIGVNYRRLGEWEKGLAYSERAIEANYQYLGYAYQGAAISLEHLGRIKEAREYYNKAVELVPGSPETLLNSAQNLIRLGDYEKALQELAKVRAYSTEEQVREEDRIAYAISLSHNEAISYLGLGKKQRYYEKLQELLGILSKLNPDTKIDQFFDFVWVPGNKEYLKQFFQSDEYKLLELIENATKGKGTVGDLKRAIQDRLTESIKSTLSTVISLPLGILEERVDASPGGGDQLFFIVLSGTREYFKYLTDIVVAGLTNQDVDELVGFLVRDKKTEEEIFRNEQVKKNRSRLVTRTLGDINKPSLSRKDTPFFDTVRSVVDDVVDVVAELKKSGGDRRYGAIRLITDDIATLFSREDFPRTPDRFNEELKNFLSTYDFFKGVPYFSLSTYCVAEYIAKEPERRRDLSKYIRNIIAHHLRSDTIFVVTKDDKLLRGDEAVKHLLLLEDL